MKNTKRRKPGCRGRRPLRPPHAVARALFRSALTTPRGLVRDEGGDAVVEAAILFPVMLMVFSALVLLAIYLPTRAALQRATQIAASAIATERSDAFVRFDENALTYGWDIAKPRFPYVYTNMFSGTGDARERGGNIIINAESSGISSNAGDLRVDCYVNNYVVYKEVVAVATREFAIPLDLSFIGFPKTLSITVASTAVVQNGEDFIRNVDLAVEFVEYIGKKLKLDNVSETISSAWTKVRSLMGW